jgi:hypothetical protein
VGATRSSYRASSRELSPLDIKRILASGHRRRINRQAASSSNEESVLWRIATWMDSCVGIPHNRL